MLRLAIDLRVFLLWLCSLCGDLRGRAILLRTLFLIRRCLHSHGLVCRCILYGVWCCCCCCCCRCRCRCRPCSPRRHPARVAASGGGEGGILSSWLAVSRRRCQFFGLQRRLANFLWRANTPADRSPHEVWDARLAREGRATRNWAS